MTDPAVKFVAMIESYPFLYNTKSKDYMRKDVTEKAWLTIGRQMRWSVTECKERWKNIRNGFVRSVKRHPVGSTAKRKKHYYLHDNLQFILPHIKGNRYPDSTDNISLSDIEIKSEPDESESRLTLHAFEENTEDDNNAPTAEPPKQIQETLPVFSNLKKKKRRTEENDFVDRSVLQYIKEKKDNKKPIDDRRMFVSSLLPDVTRLSDKNLRLFKIKTLVLLDKLLTQQDQSTEHHDDSSRIKNDHTYYDSGASRCSSVSSVDNAASTLAPSSAYDTSTPSPIGHAATTNGDATDAMESEPFFITVIPDQLGYQGN